MIVCVGVCGVIVMFCLFCVTSVTCWGEGGWGGRGWCVEVVRVEPNHTLLWYSRIVLE